jgi:tryptophan synthase alpha chain
MSRLQKLMSEKRKNILNVYCTAGYPHLNSTMEVMQALQQNGADLIELGMPYSDPLADGPVIQNSSSVALANGMSISKLFDQLKDLRKEITIPVILMGYLNPIMQYGVEKFCTEAKGLGIDGLILPDLPVIEFETKYKTLFSSLELDLIFLVTPETSEARIRKLDELSSGFLYIVSSSSITGTEIDFSATASYFNRLKAMSLKNPILAGFGIKDKASFDAVCAYTNGAIIGSAYIKNLETAKDINQSTKEFIESILL